MKKKTLIPFNVIVERNGEFVPMDIMPYLVDRWNKRKKADNIKIDEFIDNECKYQFWSRCQYEIILSDWPNKRIEKKIDVYQQIKMNIDVITSVFLANVV